MEGWAFSARALWSLVHGVVLGGIFLIAAVAGLLGIYSYGLRDGWRTDSELQPHLRRLSAGTWITALVVWLMTISGTFILYPWYRDPTWAGMPRYLVSRTYLLTQEELAVWHVYGMAWKEHMGWLAAILATVAAAITVQYGPQLGEDDFLRQITLAIFGISFLAAGIAGLLGSLLTKLMPLL
ncbi:hypothetical protein FKZ61_007620 [Litorilinea aerophila]|uniref:Uncharacterized protein n=1 Tax=Litorilinea aerophila TaxID=1204385 RepID=A0A540VJP5_9CHLR|nr:hypothetical protein [Litorilinea aerophila]MCC9075977.1 hypothetical protein [Litorilinea aerophila]OUC09704.1 hypothetical protein RY27_01225 [Litorilinea aerophila]GIV78664.1 MAG: hypothetical protein KatS3mg050_3058 [Litorilinea sp.]